MSNSKTVRMWNISGGKVDVPENHPNFAAYRERFPFEKEPTEEEKAAELKKLTEKRKADAAKAEEGTETAEAPKGRTVKKAGAPKADGKASE